MLMSIVGMGVLLGIAYAFSRNRKAISWRTVLGAFALQFGLGAFVLKVSWGQSLLASMTEGVNQLLSYGDAGIGFLFGGLVAESVGFSFALKVLPIIVFFAALIAVLYHVGIMKWIIRIIGGAATRVGHLSGRVHECHGQHLCGSNGGPRRQALHRHHDPIGIVRGHGGRFGLCGGFCARGLRVDWGSCRVPHCSVFHVGARRVVVAKC